MDGDEGGGVATARLVLASKAKSARDARRGKLGVYKYGMSMWAAWEAWGEEVGDGQCASLRGPAALDQTRPDLAIGSWGTGNWELGAGDRDSRRQRQRVACLFESLRDPMSDGLWPIHWGGQDRVTPVHQHTSTPPLHAFAQHGGRVGEYKCVVYV